MPLQAYPDLAKIESPTSRHVHDPWCACFAGPVSSLPGSDGADNDLGHTSFRWFPPKTQAREVGRPGESQAPPLSADQSTQLCFPGRLVNAAGATRSSAYPAGVVADQPAGQGDDSRANLSNWRAFIATGLMQAGHLPRLGLAHMSLFTGRDECKMVVVSVQESWRRPRLRRVNGRRNPG